ncbi:GPI biosynthesis protein Pig-F [Cokeromyces recurvatus]|uniref:GPI biosynthesis protein Pig-F n=1 Tax=Cokeromyces recurvatus TaxID=90255 RepID=UPI002220216F|nr:GPI biosynthesis protein Pig-F [Cokeromyces recurvatus]KAI7903699.1 GPI biosynthesis protein Pig-F [Cokeromyces recurvatus]
MNPFGFELIFGLLSIALHYTATFKLPSTSLLKDPVQTLSAVVPILFLGHVVLIISANLLRGNAFNKTIISLGYSILATLSGVGVLHVLAILFGASLTEKIPNTFLFSAYLSIITIMPCFESFKETAWIKVFVQHSPTTTSEIYAYAQAICALSGAWIGAIVLPLDWDREWQAWPISCVISTYVGHSVGVLAAFIWSSVKLLFGKKKSE